MFSEKKLEFEKILVGILSIFFITSSFILTDGKYSSTHGEEVDNGIEKEYVDLSYPLNINEATIDELSSIDGVNRRHAKIIVNFRKKIGIIHDLRILLDVKGIGRKTFSRLEKNTFVSFKDEPEDINYYDSKKIDKSLSTNQSIQIPKVNINQADWKSFTRIRGIGEKTAKLIIKYREILGRIDDFEQLNRVKGVGKKRIILIKEKFFIGN